MLYIYRDRQQFKLEFLKIEDFLVKEYKVKSIDDVSLEVVKFNICRMVFYG